MPLVRVSETEIYPAYYVPDDGSGMYEVDLPEGFIDRFCQVSADWHALNEEIYQKVINGTIRG